jgi:hypothetical protein
MWLLLPLFSPCCTPVVMFWHMACATALDGFSVEDQ